MLEGVLAGVIERLAGKYVDGIDKKAAGKPTPSPLSSPPFVWFVPTTTQLSVWSGNIVLKDLTLKKSALDDLDLPVTLKTGHLEELRLDIPWKNLRSQPVIVHIQGLSIVVSPNSDPSIPAAERERRMLLAKRAQVAEMDAAGLGEEEDKNGSFSSRLITKIVDNIQLNISNIHIRYEDGFVDEAHPFALGIMLASFTAAAFVEDQKRICKKCNLKGLSLYLNSDLDPKRTVETVRRGQIIPPAMVDRSCTAEPDPDALPGTLLPPSHRAEAAEGARASEGDAAGGAEAAGGSRASEGDATGEATFIVNKSDIPDKHRPKYDASLEMNRVNIK
ncbi:N-terminal region of Chorein, a TM vesicle-mediated sorter-domain-containing protein, partial [Baffinella frigidus]